MSGIVIPGMPMPSMAIPESVELWDGAPGAWQSESASANAQDRSHAAASDDADSSSVTIDPANTRLTLMNDFDAKPNRLDTANWIAGVKKKLPEFQIAALKIYFTVLFSAQTYSLICQSDFNLKILTAVQGFVYALGSSMV